MSKIHTITCHTFAVAILSLLPNSAWAQSTVTWDAGTDFIWDTTTSNWTGTTYTNGDDAQFLGSGAGTVTLSGTINPGSVTVNSANDYTFSGTAITGSGSLTKDGSGILTLSSDMTYTGGTTVNGGEFVRQLTAKGFHIFKAAAHKPLYRGQSIQRIANIVLSSFITNTANAVFVVVHYRGQ